MQSEIIRQKCYFAKVSFFNSLQRLIFIKRTSGLTLYSQIVPYDQRGHVKVYLSFIKIAIFRQVGVASLHNWGEGSIYIAIFVLICRKELISKELNTAKHGYMNNAPPPIIELDTAMSTQYFISTNHACFGVVTNKRIFKNLK